jgi:glyoxylase-like metal-dependent hydrolase (beta-lactamase superfamily II)
LKITEKVYLIGGHEYGYSAAGDCNMYLIDGGDALALIDTGSGNGINDVMGNIRRMGLESDRLTVTFNTHCHYDHIGGNKAVKEATSCKIAAHELDIGEIERPGEFALYKRALEKGFKLEPTRVDMPLRGGVKVEVGDVVFEVVHTPGHTSGGVCLLIEEEGVKGLFSGDVASANGKLNWINGPGFDLPEWKNSIKKILELRPDRLFPGHGAFLFSGAVEHLRLLDEKMNAPWVNILTEID